MSGNSRIKVLHVLTDSNIGGAGTYVSNILSNCDKDRFDMRVLLPKDSAAKRLMPDGTVIEADFTPDRSLDLASVKTIRRYIKQTGCDIVHAHGSASARLAAKGICRCVFTKHTLSEGGGALQKLMYRFTGGWAVAVSESARDNLVSLGFNKNKIFTVYNGVSDMTVPDRDARAEAKKSFGIPEDRFVVGCVARAAPVKDYPTWINAAKLISEEDKSAFFLICGDGESLPEIKALANELGIADRCVFPGTVCGVSRAYHAMDLYMGTSVSESFGQSLVEAWSAGLAAVVSDAPGFKEIAPENTAICKTGDAQAFAEAVLKLKNDPGARLTQGERGRARFSERFDCKTFSRNIENVYEKIING